MPSIPPSGDRVTQGKVMLQTHIEYLESIYDNYCWSFKLVLTSYHFYEDWGRQERRTIWTNIVRISCAVVVSTD